MLKVKEDIKVSDLAWSRLNTLCVESINGAVLALGALPAKRSRLFADKPVSAAPDVRNRVSVLAGQYSLPITEFADRHIQGIILAPALSHSIAKQIPRGACCNFLPIRNIVPKIRPIILYISTRS